MSKTPVSTLQEYMAKQGLGLPEYVIIAQTNGTHLPSFTYRVTCGQKKAEGTASCKKDAKHNAAREMLKVLSNYNNNIHQSRQSPLLSPVTTVPADSYYAPGLSNDDHDNIFINSVGKLSEHCVAHRLKQPEYILNNTSGPDHARMFTITCSIGPLKANGTANTKKQAKQNAAQNMYQTVVTTTTSKNNHELQMPETDALKQCIKDAERKLKNVQILDIKMEELSTPLAESHEKAKELFPKLRYRDSVKIVKNVEVKDYHEALKNSVDTGNLEIAQKRLRSVPVGSNETVLNEVLKVLNLKLDCTTAVKLYGECVVRCTVNSTPTISDIGFGKSIYEAKEKAMENLLNSINLLLT